MADAGGGGCRAMKAGIMTKSRMTANGRTTSRYGSKQANV